MPLDILYQDDSLVVINKPSGLLVHRSSIDAYETEFALQLVRDQLGQNVYPVHRLDKPTSGLLVFAKSSDYASQISQAFGEQKVEKSYLSIVRGYTPEAVFVDHALKPIQEDKRKRHIQKPAQEAQTLLTTLAHCEIDAAIDKYPQSRYSLVLLQPKSGRKHQLRRHMKHLSHPIIGDPKYGKSKHNHYFGEHFGAKRLLLAAIGLRLESPIEGELDLRCSPGADFEQLIQNLPWRYLATDQAKSFCRKFKLDQANESNT